MPSDEVIRLGEHVMTVCNACRYCEGYCPVFPAMEKRLMFSKGDLTYLANLCHNCGECLYACQYAPPHEFAINVPRTMARIRLVGYQDHCWPRPLAAAFRHHSLLTALTLSAALTLLMLVAALVSGARLSTPNPAGDFYSVMPHRVMVAMFSAVFAFVVAALGVGFVRFCREVGVKRSPGDRPIAVLGALRDALTLKHLHGGGVDCPGEEGARSSWRRWLHHFTAYGFLLCFASTSIAALYHYAFGWAAPYGFTSLPVVLGTVGGIGLVVGPAGLLILKRRRDTALGDPAQDGLDTSFIGLLFLTSVTGLLLLVFRAGPGMGLLLLLHLGFVLTLFVTLPYGKFVHGAYRAAALIKYALEGARPTHSGEVESQQPAPSYDWRPTAPQVEATASLRANP